MIVLFWVFFALIVGFGASSWGRSGAGWFLGALFLSPLLVGILLLLSGRASEDTPEYGFPLDEYRKRCPDCAERVRPRAEVCKHCGHEWSSEDVRRHLLAAVQDFDGFLYYCKTSDEIIPPHGVQCPACDGAVDDDQHIGAEERFSTG